MKKLNIFFLLFIVISINANAQTANSTLNRPKLVVGVVVDQMRWDYLYRYYDRYGQDGFKRLLTKGFSCENTFIPYTPTHTAAGHTCVYTGSVPAVNGILGNNWYSRADGRVVYCAEDNSVKTVGSSSDAGLMSPKNMWTTTITDELRLATNFKSKVIGIALKDRGAILPAGHSANAAYWFDNATGGWITSTHYMNDLPKWVKDFNAKKLPDTYMSKDWNTLYPINTYNQSTSDNKPYENAVAGSGTFPHATSKLKGKAAYDAFRTTPYGNTFTIDMAKAAIESEQLGKSANTDFLTVSFSSPDYIGHSFGPNSIEAEDGFLRLDKDLSNFFQYLDTKIGKGQYLLFLTADHGAAHIPGFMTENKIPAGLASSADIKKLLNDEAEKQFGVKDIIISVINYQLYLNYSLIGEKKLDEEAVTDFMLTRLKAHPGIAGAVNLHELNEETIQQTIKERLSNGYNQILSGDIQFIFKPQWFDGRSKGTSHGVWNPYDSHIPLLWYGWGIKPGKSNREVYMTDIAPTVAALLRIQMPNGCVGKVIEEVVK
ncbi:MAG: nucleotide pyrophosphatase [Niabella sp. SCN 42-15]|nr:MAG: nucleotide pyrophosphatase [Niabella sp. SCN 42-15]